MGAFEGLHKIEVSRRLPKLGADVNARERTGNPLIIDAALVDDWDVVRCFLGLGAQYDYHTGPMTIEKVFGDPTTVPPCITKRPTPPCYARA